MSSTLWFLFYYESNERIQLLTPPELPILNFKSQISKCLYSPMNNDFKSIPLDELRFPVSYLQLFKTICEARGKNFSELLKQEFDLEESVFNDPHAKIDGHKMQLVLESISAFISHSPKAQFQLIETSR